MSSTLGESVILSKRYDDWHARATIAQRPRHDKRARHHKVTVATQRRRLSIGIFSSTPYSPAMQLLSKLIIFIFLLYPCAATDIIVDWSPESVLFSKGHLVTKKFAKMRDQIVFDCPEDMPISILMVTKEEAIKCDASERYNQSLLGLCTPERKRINFVVRDFSLLPNVPIFKEGEEYYFISTSNGTENGMKNPTEGLCKSHDMRLALKVSGKATSKSDTNRSPDILTLLSPFTEPSPPVEDMDLNRVITKERSKPLTTTPPPEVVDVTAPYPAYVVFPDRLSIIVKSEKELRNVIDSYMESHKPTHRNYNIYPIKDKPEGYWDNPRFPASNTQYEVQGTASPLSSEHQPHFEVESDLSQRRRKISEQHRASRTQIGRNQGFDNLLPFDYEIGYEDAFSEASPSKSISLLHIFLSIVIARIVLL